MNYYDDVRMQLKKTHLSLMNSIASSRFLTGITGRIGPNNSLYDGVSS